MIGIISNLCLSRAGKSQKGALFGDLFVVVIGTKGKIEKSQHFQNTACRNIALFLLWLGERVLIFPSVLLERTSYRTVIPSQLVFRLVFCQDGYSVRSSNSITENN